MLRTFPVHELTYIDQLDVLRFIHIVAISAIVSFYLWTIILLEDDKACCLIIFLSIDVLSCFSFCTLQIKLIELFLYKCFCGNAFLSV